MSGLERLVLDHKDHKRSLKRPLSKSRSRSQSFSGSEASMSLHDGKFSVQILISDDLCGSLMAGNLKLLESIRSKVSPVTVWINPRPPRRDRSVRREMRTMLLRADSRVLLDEARVQIHQFLREKLEITVDGILPPASPPSSSTSQSHLKTPRSQSSLVDEKKPLVLPFALPTPTPSVSRTPDPNHSDIQNSPEAPGARASSLLHENYCPAENSTSEKTIPIFMEVNEEFVEMVEIVRHIIKLKFPETEVLLQKVSGQDNPDQKTGGASHVIFIRGPTPLCLVVAKAVILHEFKDRLGVSLEEENPRIKELEEKLEKSEELVMKHQNEIKNLRAFNAELEQNRAYYKDKYIKKFKNDKINEKEFEKMKMKLKSSQNDFELAVNEKAKLSKKVMDLESQLEEYSEFIRIVKSCDKNDNDENPEDDQNKEMCLKCPHLLFEIKNLRESLALAEGLVSLREQELDLLKKKKSNFQEENNADISG